MKLGAIILAGGLSSRMGKFKPLMKINNRTLVHHCIDLFQSINIERVITVTGFRGDEVAVEVRKNNGIHIHNSQFQKGMYSSILASVPHMADLDGFFILPVDIPLIRKSSIQLLISQWNNDHVIYPNRKEVRGHPPLISSRIIHEILNYNGKGGLRKLLEKYPAKDVKVWDDGMFMDADTSHDFNCLKQRYLQLHTGSRAEAEAIADIFMPPSLQRHGEVTAEVGDKLSKELIRSGCQVNLDMVHNGALLHDIAKGKPYHEKLGSTLVSKLGLSNLSEIIANHKITTPNKPGVMEEKDIVCLADKLVSGDEIVPLEKRFYQKLHRYKDDKNASQAIKRRMQKAIILQDTFESITQSKLTNIIATK
jgi:molybdenum cofactor cytidylyltransferase